MVIIQILSLNVFTHADRGLYAVAAAYVKKEEKPEIKCNKKIIDCNARLIFTENFKQNFNYWKKKCLKKILQNKKVINRLKN